MNIRFSILARLNELERNCLMRSGYYPFAKIGAMVKIDAKSVFPDFSAMLSLFVPLAFTENNGIIYLYFKNESSATYAKTIIDELLSYDRALLEYEVSSNILKEYQHPDSIKLKETRLGFKNIMLDSYFISYVYETKSLNEDLNKKLELLHVD